MRKTQGVGQKVLTYKGETVAEEGFAPKSPLMPKS